MTTRQKIKIALLKALLAMDGVPMPDEALIAAGVNMVFPHPTVGNVETARNELETERLIFGNDSSIRGRNWTLTDAGQHEAQKS